MDRCGVESSSFTQESGLAAGLYEQSPLLHRDSAAGDSSRGLSLDERGGEVSCPN